MGKAFFGLLFIFIASSSFSQSGSALVLSEIMFNPVSGNNEFIEIYNTSETQSFDLANYKIFYYNSNADIIASAGFGTILPPKSFAVIFEGDYDLEAGIYSTLVPSGSLKLKISDNSFGTSGMANTTGRPVWLVDASNDTIDSYSYSANNGTGYSDEKIVMTINSAAANWANCLVLNGSPGLKNSVTPLNYDLSVKRFSVSSFNPAEGQDVSISAVIYNSGYLTAVNYLVEIYNDSNLDSVGTTTEIIYSNTFSNLMPGDSNSINTILTSIKSGNYQLISNIVFYFDEDTTNNKKIIQFTAYPPAHNYNDLVINEIMYAPFSGESEWVEIFNRTSEPINLKKWKIGDNSSSVLITNSDLIIQPSDYFVLSRDSSITNYFSNLTNFSVLSLPSLNNTGDAVVLKDSLSVLIDSIAYLPDWGGNEGGKSLERISINSSSTLKNNWGTSQSIFKATPGFINSLTPKDFDLKISAFKMKNDFALIGELADFEIKILNRGLNTSQNYILNIFNDSNKDSIPQIFELIGQVNGNSLAPGDSSALSFLTSSFIQGKNYFIARLDITPDYDSTNNIAFANFSGVAVNEVRNDIVINEIMYAPNSPEPEWIEIYNRSHKTIDLKNYKFAENSDTLTIITSSTLFSPGEFFVISASNTLTSFYNLPSPIAAVSFPSLNNAGDKLILLDSLNRTIDSLQYLSSWGGSSGRSLERIMSEYSSIDSSNWKTSQSKYKATPGYINSVTQKEYDIQVTDIVFNLEFPFFGDNISVSVKVKNTGTNPANFNLKLWDDVNLDSLANSIIAAIDGVNILAGDSVVAQFNYSIANIQSELGFLVTAYFTQDQDTSSNYFYKRISPGYLPGTILINEIMYSPINGEPEWVEIYNNSNDSINLKNWSIADILTTPTAVKINNEIYFEGKSYLILTKDSTLQFYHRAVPAKVSKLSIPNLNNDIDGVILKDNRGLTIDSVKYFSDWGGTGGKSLERLSLSSSSNLSGNWGSSIDLELSTPGRINSITPKQFDLSITEISFTPRFPTNGENVFINAKVKNNGSSPAVNFSVEFLVDTDSNQIVSQLLSRVDGLNLNSSDSALFTSSSSINNLNSKILGAAKIIFQNDEDTLNNYAEKTVEPGFSEKSVIINEILYAPENGEPEWVELVNISNQPIDLKDWSISDVLTTPTKAFITNTNVEIQPGEYFIITRDTSFYNFHSQVNYKVFIRNFGSLGNNEDGIILYDFRSGIIDSFSYKSSFGGTNGYSLERISTAQSTNDSSNWITSLSVSRSTPGEQNSIFNIPSYERNNLVVNEIMFDPDIDNSEFVEFLNISGDTVNVGGWKIQDENDNTFKLSQTSMPVPPNQYFLMMADTLTLSKYNLDFYPFKSVLKSSSLGLINTGELILLKDARGNTIDSVWYSDKWHNRNFIVIKNISLERINPNVSGNDSKNWNSNVNSLGASPGNTNSIFTENQNRSNKISVSPNPFSPDNDGFEDFTLINYSLSQQTSQVRIKIYDSRGRLVRTLLSNQPSGTNGSVVFDGIGDDGAALRIGIYIIFLEAINETEGVVENLKTTVVVARKL